MKDGKTILLLIVSLCLVATWGYHIYDKSKYSADDAVPVKNDSAVNQQTVNDSLQRNYASALIKLGTVQVDKDSLNTELNNKIIEIDSLRNEVSTILNVTNITKEDLKKAEDKINVLQQKIQQLNKGPKTGGNTAVKDIRNNATEGTVPGPVKNTTLPKVETATSNLSATNTSVRAIVTGSKEQTTTKADAAESFIVSCSLLNSNTSFNNAEIYIVLSGPGGHIIQDDQWQAGMFSTSAGLRIPYTRKSVMNYSKGEIKRISVNIKPGEIEAGSYSVQVYHNGQRIGKSDLRLN